MKKIVKNILKNEKKNGKNHKEAKSQKIRQANN